MSIALIGASGNADSRILKELSDRGRQVKAIARHPEEIAKLPNVTAKKGDVFDKDGLASLLKGHDIVVSAVPFTASDPRILIDAVKSAGAKRYLVVGGAGSLEVAPGVKLIDTPDFPDAYKAEAARGGEFLELLRRASKNFSLSAGRASLRSRQARRSRYGRISRGFQGRGKGRRALSRKTQGGARPRPDLPFSVRRLRSRRATLSARRR
jgi:uncharacterized protein YbjT (DUF2867 family)